MSKRKIMMLALCVSMIAILAVGGTLAYFTADDEATNTFTVGNVSIDLTEEAWDEEGGGKEQAKESYPGEALPKDPTVTNDGANPCFVRIAITGWDALINAELSEENIAYRTNYVVGALGENWVEHTDGFFYYTKVLEVEESTSALFDHIVMPTDMINGDAETEYNLQVNAYAVQAQGAKPAYADVQAMTVEEIAAWFTTCGF